ncbi:MAG: helicase [Acidobacteria bacterium]|nr:MAG: helicase [Acidobacteriota bacterium]REK04418.1 MAG: helicase [Acidobacteriota bacterium]
MSDPQNKPLIVQGADTVLLEVSSPLFEQARSQLLRFAELVKAPEHVHTYRITALSIWNARSAGLDAGQMVAVLREYSRYPVPEAVVREITTHASRFGRLRIVRDDEGLVLEPSGEEQAGEGPSPFAEATVDRDVQKWLGAPLRAVPARGDAGAASGGRERQRFRVDPEKRGLLKLALVRAGFPPADEAGYSDGDELSFEWRDATLAGEVFELRDYQIDAARAFVDSRYSAGGSGVVVLPCGAGKTIVGLACMHALQTTTLVLCTSVSAAKQWVAEALDKTTLSADQVGIYGGDDRELKPVTVATYQMLTYRRSRDEAMVNLSIFDRANWGLIVYDEVHLLPAPVFQVTAGLQARRRLGLTATLVREDGREEDVFALIGPKKVDVPWRELEAQGWVATALCTEVRVPLPVWQRLDYAKAQKRQRFRIAAENPDKLEVVRRILESHPGEPALVMCMYLEQVKELGSALRLPVLMGSSSQKKRDELFAALEHGEIAGLVVSKVANFSIDLPEVAVAVQVSGTFGSRQEEAQRLGRVLRPKSDGRPAHFYTVVSSGTVEEEFALNRQRFLLEQGYEYRLRYVGEPADDSAESEGVGGAAPEEAAAATATANPAASTRLLDQLGDDGPVN